MRRWAWGIGFTATLIWGGVATAQTPVRAWFDRITEQEWTSGNAGFSQRVFNYGDGAGSRQHFQYGSDDWSLQGLIHGTGPISFHTFRYGTEPGSAYFWRYGRTFGSEYYWRYGSGCLSEQQWRYGGTGDQACPAWGQAQQIVILLCLAGYLEIAPCDAFTAAAEAARPADLARFRTEAQELQSQWSAS